MGYCMRLLQTKLAIRVAIRVIAAVVAVESARWTVLLRRGGTRLRI